MTARKRARSAPSKAVERPQPIACVPRRLSEDLRIRAAEIAQEQNPANAALLHRVRAAVPGVELHPARAALLIANYWPTHTVNLTVGFLDGDAPSALQRRILAHMNAWNKTANVRFTLARAGVRPQVRITFRDGNWGGYWSYVGTQILAIPAHEPTMNLQGFNVMDMPESEYRRVVRHETGHTMGFVHEHMRRELVALIDVEKAIKFYGETQHWTPEEVRQQVLTPIEEGSVRGTAHADPKSIMCYQIPAEITTNHKTIVGGLDIDASDYRFAATMFPRAKAKQAAKKKKKK
ncbi:MAG: peptidase M12 [Gemmatimonadetes bacterium]|nr:peptidase M12 [Gemmatimonadota bacterium]